MDNKRLIAAIVLSMGIFLGWQWLGTKMGWIPATPEPTTASAPQTIVSAGDDHAAASPVAAESTIATFTPSHGKEVVVDTPLYKAVFHSQGGVLQEFLLKEYKRDLESNQPVNLISAKAAGLNPMGLILARQNTAVVGKWAFSGSDLALTGHESGVLRFTGQMDGMHIIREFTFSAENYVIAEKVTVQSDKARDLAPAFTMATEAMDGGESISLFARLRYMIFGGEKPQPSASAYNPTAIAWMQDGSFDKESSESTLAEGKRITGHVAWGAVMDNYFLCAVSMPKNSDATLFSRFQQGIYSTSLGMPDAFIDAGATKELHADYYLGPKTRTALAHAPNDLDKALHYGFFTIIANPLIALLLFLYGYVGNYGVAIILMTIIVKAVFWPLSQTSYRSMERMKQLQPELLKLREKYGDDKEELNKATIQLYRTHKVNPAGGCLPILVQLPVFFGLYQGLLNSIELRHSTFIEFLPFTQMPWLNDLSAGDPFFITPLIMGLSMFLQQKMAPPAGDPMQQKIMLMLPLIFTGVCLSLPSGLVIYWLVNNIISIAQQWLLRTKSKVA